MPTPAPSSSIAGPGTCHFESIVRTGETRQLATSPAPWAAMDELDRSDDVSIGVITGSGGHFCSVSTPQKCAPGSSHAAC